MQFDSDSHNDYNNHFGGAAMYGNCSLSSTTNPYYYDATATIPPNDPVAYELDEYAPTDLLPHPANPKGLYQDKGKRPKRKQVKNACVNCQKACKKCDDGRACQRCIKLGITDTCVDSPRKERRKGGKRGPYRKRQYASTSCYEIEDSHQTMSATTTSAIDWEEKQQAAYTAAAAAAAAAPLIPNSIITPLLSQQESPLSSSPLSSDADCCGYTSGAVSSATDCALCLSPTSPDFPSMDWNDPNFLDMLAPLQSQPLFYNQYQADMPVLVQDLPVMHYEEQYPMMMPEESAESFYYNKPSHQHSSYASEESVFSSCAPSTLWLHLQQQQQQYLYPQYQPQQTSGFWESFSSTI